MTESLEELGVDQEGSTARTTDPHPVPRPSRSDTAVINAAVEELLPGIEEWASGEDVSDARNILRNALRGNTDGYELAREFDRAGWSVDFQLAGVLDEADNAIYQAHRVAVREWLAANGVRPRLSVGAAVVFPAGSNAGTQGEVVRVDERDGTYTVCAASLGHVRTGLGTYGRIFTWEALEAANVVACELAVDPSRSTPKSSVL